MESLLEHMTELADQAGDWRDHLPYAAALGYLEDSEYRDRYGSHVDDCRYCQQLIDALHPREENVAQFLSALRYSAVQDVHAFDHATALFEARSSLDEIREVFVASHHSSVIGKLKHWANAQRWLADAHESIDGSASLLVDAWSANIALSLDTPSRADSSSTDCDWISSDVEKVASFLLAFGFRVAHAGDLRSDGISERLFRLGQRYGRRMYAGNLPPDRSSVPAVGYGVTSYCAWPVHIGTPIEELESYATNRDHSGYVHFLSLDGKVCPYTHFVDSERHEPNHDEWSQGLASMRDRMIHDSFARVVVGGDTGFRHQLMPSLAEDALSSLRNRQPLYILAGFGGCAGDLALALHLTESPYSSGPDWGDLEKFAPYMGAESLCNGLNADENKSLVESEDIEEAMQLVLLGLDRVSKRMQRTA